MNKTSKDSTTTLKVVCAILFILFIYSYIYKFQGDILGMIQYAWSGGKTHYNKEIGAVIIALVSLLIVFVTSLFTRLPQRTLTLNYFPAFLALGLLTAVSLDGNTVIASTAWMIISALMFIIYIFVVRAVRSYIPFLMPLRGTGFLSHPWWTNLTIMAAMAMLTYSMGNTSRDLHTRLNVENHCREHNWKAALQDGIPQYDNDSSMTMLRAMALAREGALGEHLFKYDVMGGSRALWPQKDKSVGMLLGDPYILWQTIGVIPRNTDEPIAHFMKKQIRRGHINSCGKDYLLCSYLLDRNLEAFISELPKYYTLNDSLPKHYQEAYVIYSAKRNLNDSIINSALKTDYADFMTTMRSTKDKTLRHSAIREAYFGTYWYYYHNK